MTIDALILRMRYVFFAFFVLGIFIKPSFGQERNPSYTDKKDSSRLDIGIKAGVNFAEFWGKDALPEKRYKIGYSAGFYLGMPLKKGFSFATEFIWSLQGDDTKKSGTYFLSYFNVPATFKWKRKNWFLEFGPQLGFLVQERSEDVPEALRILNFQTVVLSANAGVGYKIWEDLAIGFRYNLGLTPIAEDLNIRSDLLYLGLTYRVF